MVYLIIMMSKIYRMTVTFSVVWFIIIIILSVGHVCDSMKGTGDLTQIFLDSVSVSKAALWRPLPVNRSVAAFQLS